MVGGRYILLEREIEYRVMDGLGVLRLPVQVEQVEIEREEGIPGKSQHLSFEEYNGNLIYI